MLEPLAGYRMAERERPPNLTSELASSEGADAWVIADEANGFPPLWMSTWRSVAGSLLIRMAEN